MFGQQGLPQRGRAAARRPAAAVAPAARGGGARVASSGRPLPDACVRSSGIQRRAHDRPGGAVPEFRSAVSTPAIDASIMQSCQPTRDPDHAAGAAALAEPRPLAPAPSAPAASFPVPQITQPPAPAAAGPAPASPQTPNDQRPAAGLLLGFGRACSQNSEHAGARRLSATSLPRAGCRRRCRLNPDPSPFFALLELKSQSACNVRFIVFRGGRAARIPSVPRVHQPSASSSLRRLVECRSRTAPCAGRRGTAAAASSASSRPARAANAGSPVRFRRFAPRWNDARRATAAASHRDAQHPPTGSLTRRVDPPTVTRRRRQGGVASLLTPSSKTAESPTAAAFGRARRRRSGRGRRTSRNSHAAPRVRK